VLPYWCGPPPRGLAEGDRAASGEAATVRPGAALKTYRKFSRGIWGRTRSVSSNALSQVDTPTKIGLGLVKRLDVKP